MRPRAEPTPHVASPTETLAQTGRGMPGSAELADRRVLERARKRLFDGLAASDLEALERSLADEQGR